MEGPSQRLRLPCCTRARCARSFRGEHMENRKEIAAIEETHPRSRESRWGRRRRLVGYGQVEVMRGLKGRDSDGPIGHCKDQGGRPVFALSDYLSDLSPISVKHRLYRRAKASPTHRGRDSPEHVLLHRGLDRRTVRVNGQHID